MSKTWGKRGVYIVFQKNYNCIVQSYVEAHKYIKSNDPFKEKRLRVLFFVYKNR